MAPFGIYLHVPFCASRCDYCAFATWTDRHHLIRPYLAAVGVELGRAVDAGLPPVTSVFVGGGTPSLVPPDELAAVIGAIPVAADVEITVECNPDDVDDSLVATLVDAGVTRLSLGVQSASPHVLRSLGRTHDVRHVGAAVQALRDGGVGTFNLDLIYGAVGETVADWETTLAAVLEFDPPHVAAYALMAEAGTPLAADVSRHPDGDDQADKYLLAESALVAAGLANYEISNWARPGHRSAHNELYWAQGDYLGIGCAAHSHRGGRRWWNVRTPDRYVDLIERGEPVEASGETLDAETQRFERRQLALRTHRGVERSAFAPEVLEELGGLIVGHPADPDRVVLTARGRLLADDIATRFVDHDGDHLPAAPVEVVGRAREAVTSNAAEGA